MSEPTTYSIRPTTRAYRRAMEWLADYHRWELVGVENVPAEGGAIVTCTHSLATYDLFIMGCASRTLVGRQAYIVGDDLMFRLPTTADALFEIGLVPGGRESVLERLRDGYLIGIAPGGMQESLKGMGRDADFDWSRRRGFVWVSMLSGAPIVPAVCPNANEIFTVYPNPVTSFVYERLRVPMPVFRGIGLTALPRPVKLISVLGAPIYPDVAPDRVTAEDVARMHERVVDSTRKLNEQARAMGDRVPDGVRAVHFRSGPRPPTSDPRVGGPTSTPRNGVGR